MITAQQHSKKLPKNRANKVHDLTNVGQLTMSDRQLCDKVAQHCCMSDMDLTNIHTISL